ncbi:MAG: dihydrolipoamide acetyltransferase family protein [Gemmatimonadota bacterium]|nr:dihydrolipoamide acetyltransferase family protein [Gemmatimonadota bacterium]
MAEEWRFQDPGEGIHEGEILDVRVSEGDEVEDGQIVLEVETDKAAVEVPAPFTGTIEEIRVAEGDIVEVGDVLMTWRGESAPAEEAEEDRSGGAAAVGELETWEETEEEEEAGQEEKRRAPREPEEDAGPVPASPATRRLAREEGIDLREVEPSGPGGRVTMEDVRARAGEAAPGEEEAPEEEAPEAAPAASPPLVEELPPAPEFERWGEVDREPLRSVRRATARRMAVAWARVPHVTHMDVADVTELEAFRAEHADAVAEEGGDLSLTVLALKAAVAALKEHPRFNASLDEAAAEIVLKRYYHLGVAVDTDRGLVVPVLRDVDRKSLTELAVEASEVVERAREGDLERSEMRGGSFTVTNPGPLGGTAFTPIVNWPEVAILGLARAARKPVVRGEGEDVEVVPRLLLPICLGFDHRVNDGADAARFAATLVGVLEDPEELVLHL